MEPFIKLDKESVHRDTIAYLSGEGNYSWIHFATNQRPIIIATTLKRMALQLPNFVRIHKKTLINPIHVETCDLAKRTGTITLKTGLTLNISRRRIDQTRQLCKR